MPKSCSKKVLRFSSPYDAIDHLYLIINSAGDFWWIPIEGDIQGPDSFRLRRTRTHGGLVDRLKNNGYKPYNGKINTRFEAALK